MYFLCNYIYKICKITLLSLVVIIFVTINAEAESSELTLFSVVEKLSKRKTNTLKTVESYVGQLNINYNGELGFKKLLEEHELLTYTLISQLANSLPLGTILKLGQQQGFDLDTMLKLLFLASSEPLTVVENIAYSRAISQEKIVASAIENGVATPEDVLAIVAAYNPKIETSPLIESASVTLFNLNKNDNVKLYFKSVVDKNWRQPIEMIWEPIQEVFTTSLFYLQPNTTYEVRALVSTRDVVNGVKSKPQEIVRKFTTWPSQPPIDKDKIYYVSQIYQGGQLNLEKLGIEGSEKGWAKIIGDVPIVVNDAHKSALFIGDNSYIYFEDLVIKGGKRYSIYSKNAHHLWFKGCEVFSWGRMPSVYKNGIAYESAKHNYSINKDSAFALDKTGVVVVEDCHVHSPNMGANNWDSGHPQGSNALLAHAYHPLAKYRGQYVIRNNRFVASDKNRFNDVIEGRGNGFVWGGFVRDTAIYNNILAYANDDIIELDGGQNNVALYNNTLQHGYCGVSLAPNMHGPSYVFNNDISQLSDDRGRAFAAFKLGGFVSRPQGLSYIFYNFVRTNSNGVTAARYDNDYTFWVYALNNVLLHNIGNSNRRIGYSISDISKYSGSKFINNYMFNMVTKSALYDANLDETLVNIETINSANADSIWQQRQNNIAIAIPKKYYLPNVTKLNDLGLVIIGPVTDLD